MKNLTWQNPEQLFVAQVLINKVKSKCCGIKDIYFCRVMILIIDDDSAIRSSLSFMLKRAKYEVQAVSGPKEAMEAIHSVTPQLILMDMNFSLSTDGAEGLVLLKQVKLFCPDVPVILMTAWGSIPLAVQGMRAGAFDFITKPWNNAALMQRIETALELTSREEVADTSTTEDEDFDRSHIIGKSKALEAVLATVKKVSRTSASVLVTGESGTGKELIAEAIHLNSLRRNKPFVKVNLGGISQTLFESEMFGHKKGAFTDAVTDRKGRFELADKGTIFLDEIGELDLSCQVKLLRVLQEQTFEPLGESRPRKVDVRVVCATNANLEQMVHEHTFREDLLYRINLIAVHLPALRERREDIPLLARHFVENRCREDGLPLVKLSERCLGVFKPFALSWEYPGTEEPGRAYLVGVWKRLSDGRGFSVTVSSGFSCYRRCCECKRTYIGGTGKTYHSSGVGYA